RHQQPAADAAGAEMSEEGIEIDAQQAAAAMGRRHRAGAAHRQLAELAEAEPAERAERGVPGGAEAEPRSRLADDIAAEHARDDLDDDCEHLVPSAVPEQPLLLPRPVALGLAGALVLRLLALADGDLHLGHAAMVEIE